MTSYTFAPWSDTSLESALEFSLLYGAFIGLQDAPNRARSLEETRLSLQVLDGFDAVSDEVQGNRRLKLAGGVLTLPDPAFKLLLRTVESAAATAPFVHARRLLHLFEALQALAPDSSS